jgi:hypothetical protein
MGTNFGERHYRELCYTSDIKMSTATERMRQFVWPEIQAMMLNDAHSYLLFTAAQLTKKFRGPTAKLLQDGYLTYQIVSIRRLCDKSDDVYSLHAALEQAEKENPDFYPQIAAFKAFLHLKCHHVYEEVNKRIAHSANPAKSRGYAEWNMDIIQLETAQHAICCVAVIFNRDILRWKGYGDIIPVQQEYFGEDLMLSEEMRDKLNQAWHDKKERVEAWRRLPELG